MKSEIFDHPCEYFKVIYWGFFPPDNNKLMGRKPITRGQIEENYKFKINKIVKSKNEEKIKYIENYVLNRINEEEERKKTIEKKAHALIGQSSIAVTLLLAAVSIGTSQYDYLPLYFKIFSWMLYLILILNFVTAGLHARNAVALLEGYAVLPIEDFLVKKNAKLNLILSAYHISERNSYLNDVKGTYLRFSHWFFKFSFFLTIFIALLFPPSLMVINYYNKSYNPHNDKIKIESTKQELNEGTVKKDFHSYTEDTVHSKKTK